MPPHLILEEIYSFVYSSSAAHISKVGFLKEPVCMGLNVLRAVLLEVENLRNPLYIVYGKYIFVCVSSNKLK